MKTENFIHDLAARTPPPAAKRSSLVLFGLGGLVLAGTGFVAIAGARPDLGTAWISTLLKMSFGALCAVVLAPLLWRVAGQNLRIGAAAGGVIGVVALAGIVSIVGLPLVSMRLRGVNPRRLDPAQSIAAPIADTGMRYCAYAGERVPSLTSIIAALAEPTRLNAIRRLWDGEEHCVSELMDLLGATQSRMSRHMATLKTAGLVLDRRDAQWVRYRRNPKLDPIIAKTVAAIVRAADALDEPLSSKDAA